MPVDMLEASLAAESAAGFGLNAVLYWRLTRVVARQPAWARLPGRLAPSLRGSLILALGLAPPVLLEPTLDVLSGPYFALRQVGDRCWEVLTAGDLVSPLPAHPAKSYTYFMGPHQWDSVATHTATL